MRELALTYLRTALNDVTANFRDDQWEAIEAIVVRNSRLLVVERTGWGKSLVYFLATRLLRSRGSGPTLIISPLLALMRNQLEAADRLGVRAATINSSNRTDHADILRRLAAGEIDILYVSPERLADLEFVQQVLIPIAATIGLFAVDEAHCISDWGHDFRPDYRRIVRILNLLPPNIPVIATTATANNRVVRDVQGQLGNNLQIIRGPLRRDSLSLQNIVLPDQASRLAWLAEVIPNLEGSGIVYTLTIADAERVAQWLQSAGVLARAYHAGRPEEECIQLEMQLLNNDIKVLVATSKLGMGFDKPDVNFVIHYQRPASVVHYYQQVGRAGRNIPNSYGVLLSGREDEEIAEFFIQSAFPPQAHVDELLRVLLAAPTGLSVNEIQGLVNLSKTRIDATLRFLSAEFPSPIRKQGAKYFANPVQYALDQPKIAEITAIRRTEQDRMRGYLAERGCLMTFLSRELDDPNHAQCGRCYNCAGRLLPLAATNPTIQRAITFLRRSNLPIPPRKKWLGDALIAHNWRGNIPDNLLAETGRALSLWGDAGWGSLVRAGREAGRFSDELVAAFADMIRGWPLPQAPAWIACVPSLRNPAIVPDFATRVGRELAIPFIPCITKVRDTPQQKSMRNSYQQCRNLSGAFQVAAHMVQAGPVLLVDDIVNSRWTSTIVSALLREAGAGPVYPVALALTTTSSD